MFFGRISYGMYLIQGIVVPLVQTLVRRWLGERMHLAGAFATALLAIVSFTITLALALASWRLIERPILGMARKYAFFRPARSTEPGL
jgi:peptidoglycan/LPS O-acetylase OafA/YrhL